MVTTPICNTGGIACRSELPSKSAAKFYYLALLHKIKNKIIKFSSSPTLTADFFQNPVLHIAAGRYQQVNIMTHILKKYLSLITISTLVLACSSNLKSDVKTIKVEQFSENEIYEFLNTVYSDSLEKGKMFLLAYPENPNYFEEYISHVKWLDMDKSITFYNLKEYRVDGSPEKQNPEVDFVWDSLKLHENFVLAFKFLDANNPMESKKNKYYNKYLYSLSIPLLDSTGNYAIIKEEVLHKGHMFSGKYMIFERKEKDWILYRQREYI